MINITRPAFENLCSGVAVMFNTREMSQYDSARSVPQQQYVIKKAYQRGADYLHEADCQCCEGTGISPAAKAA